MTAQQSNEVAELGEAKRAVMVSIGGREELDNLLTDLDTEGPEGALHLGESEGTAAIGIERVESSLACRNCGNDANCRRFARLKPSSGLIVLNQTREQKVD